MQALLNLERRGRAVDPLISTSYEGFQGRDGGLNVIGILLRIDVEDLRPVPVWRCGVTIE
jgi:hypothetical protein